MRVIEKVTTILGKKSKFICYGFLSRLKGYGAKRWLNFHAAHGPKGSVR